MKRRHALVLGGTGVIGSAVVRELVRRGVPTTFTFLNAEAKAQSLAAEFGVTSIRVDLTDAAEIRRMFETLDSRSIVPDVLVHCAAVAAGARLADLSEADFDRAVALSGRCAVLVAKEMAPRLAGSPGHIVLVSALDRAQSLPLAPAFAAAQGMLGPLAMSLAKELGSKGIRVNVVAGGVVGGGVAAAIDPKRIEDYQKLSALRRLGTAEEVAAAVAFLALDNEYMTGRTLAANGGI